MGAERHVLAPLVLRFAAFVALSGCAHFWEKGGTLVPLAPQGVTAPASRPRKMALLIGIDHFDDPRFPPLRYATKDAQGLAQAIEGFDEVRVLSEPAQTNRAAILQAISDLGMHASDARDTVLIYFSTHGSLGQRPGQKIARYLVGSDTRLDLVAETGISVDALIKTAESLRARRVALILATCHSGGGKSQISDTLASALERHKAPPLLLSERSEAIVLLTAAAFGETARESDELHHDVYTHFFLQGLRDGDRDGNGAVTVTEAHDFAREKTYEFTHGAQRPTAESSILGSDPIVLRGAPTHRGKPVLYSYTPSSEGVAVLVDGTAKGSLPGGIALDPGRHQLELRDAHSGASLYRGAINVHAGQREELSSFIPPRPRIGVEVEAASQIALSSHLGNLYLPPAFGGSVRGTLSGPLARRLRLSIGFSLLSGRGSETAFSTVLPFSVVVERIDGHIGYDIPLGSKVSLGPIISLGAEWVQREQQTPTYSGRQTLSGFTFGGGLRLAWALGAGIALGVRAHAEGLVARIDNSPGPHPLINVGLFLGYTVPLRSARR